MRRRSLLASLAGSTLLGGAGCAALSPCPDVSIREASIEVVEWCDTGDAIDASVLARTVGCDETLTLRVSGDGGVYGTDTIEDPRGDVQFRVDSGGSVPRSDEVVQFEIEGPRGFVVASQSATPGGDDEEEEAEPNLRIERPRLDADTVTAGDPVAATCKVASHGAETAFELALLADAAPVATLSDAVPADRPCESTTTEVLRLEHAFEESGTYELALRVEPAGEGSGGRASVGTVTVEES